LTSHYVIKLLSEVKSKDLELASLKTRLDNTVMKYSVIKETFVHVERDNKRLSEELADLRRRNLDKKGEFDNEDGNNFLTRKLDRAVNG
jgi:hypothetical protein